MRAIMADLGRRTSRISSFLLCIAVCLVLSDCGTPSREIRQINENVLEDRGTHYARLSDGLTHFELAVPERVAQAPQRKPSVVLVHGAMGPMCMWDNQFQALKEHGALDIYACVTHGVLSGDALRRIEDSAITEMVITDTVHHSEANLPPKISVLSTAEIFGETIRRIWHEESVSKLFD